MDSLEKISRLFETNKTWKPENFSTFQLNSQQLELASESFPLARDNFH